MRKDAVSPASLVRESVRSFSPHFPSAEGREGCVRLDLNEISGLHSPALLRAIGIADEEAVGSYPTYADFIRALAAYAKVSTVMLHPTNGSDDAIPRVVRLFFEPGSTVLLPVPTFPTYNESLELHGIQTKQVLYREKGSRFPFPTDETLRALRRGIAGLMVCTPGNPMGSRIAAADLERLARKTFSLNVPFIVDEAYFEYGGVSAIPIIRRYPNIVVLRTFSKFLGFPGLRLGYVVAHPSVISEFHKLTLPWDVNHPSARAGAIALRRIGHFKLEVRRTKARKKLLEKQLRAQGATVYETFTNFSICKVPDAARFVAELHRRGVLVKPLAYAGGALPVLTQCVRITTPGKDTMGRATRALAEALAAIMSK